MKPKHIKEKRETEVRHIQKRQREIYNEIRNLGYIKLEKPIRHGWFKEIIITQNIERYKNKAHILELYDIIEKRFWGSTKEKANKKSFSEFGFSTGDFGYKDKEDFLFHMLCKEKTIQLKKLLN